VPLLQSLLHQGRSQPEWNEPDFKAHEREARRLADQAQIPLREGARPPWDFSKISIFPPNQQPSPPQLRFRPKLVIGAVNDPLEYEADRVAGQVMRMAQPELSITAVPAQLRRKCAACEEEEQTTMLRTKPTGPAETAAGAAPPIVHEVLREPGQPLDPGTRAFFEPRFGHDFSQVRIHTDGKAAESARAINALAFTGGSNIVFAQGRYEPNSEGGRHLLAHELAHTVQQGSHSTVRRVIRSDPAAPLDNYVHGKGILGISKSGNAYSTGRRSTVSAEQEVLVDMLASPRVFNVDGASTPDAEKSLSDHVTARLGIVGFAAQKKYSFASVTGFKMNPQYYDIFPDKLAWKLKSGVDKQAAWQDLNLNPQLYAIGCKAATDLTQAGGSKGAKFGNQPSHDESDWISGDAGYVTNKMAPPGQDIGLLGENIIYVGSGQFWGHFSGNLTYRTLAEWKAEVAKWNGGGAAAAAEVDSKREYPMTGLL
jgi:hypothetical protein